jgi:hypothetical protein
MTCFGVELVVDVAELARVVRRKCAREQAYP